MNLSISNIAWNKEDDKELYLIMQEQGYTGLEIAPTRIFSQNPYEKLDEARNFAESLKNDYGVCISSMQSIWFGKKQNVFSSKEEREELFKYTKQAIKFAQACGCNNLVFGCPSNRSISKVEDYLIAKEFFYSLGEYAKEHETILSIEPNPKIYNTNFINFTHEAFKIVEEVNSDGFKVNIDLGSIIYNNEDIEWIKSKLNKVNHIHISEPYLEKIKVKNLHKQFARELKKYNYDKFISIEMKNNNNKINDISIIMKEIKQLF